MEDIQANDLCTGYDRNSIHQIQKKDNDTTPTSKYNIFPLTYVQAVYDARDGRRLDTILDQCNSVYVYWRGSAEKTRLALPMFMRRKGIIITYRNADDEVITEKCIYDDCISDEVFGLDNHWVRITDALPITGNVTIGSNGNWFIDGEDTGFKAQGPKGEDGLPLIPRVSEDKTKIEYSYNNEDWYEMFPLSLITPTIEVSPAVELAPGSNPTVTNKGDAFNVNLEFGLPKSPTVNVGEVKTYAAGHKVTVENSGTEYQAILDFGIPMGNTGAKGEKGDGWEVKGWVDTEGELPPTGTLGDLYIVGTAQPYSSYVWKDSVDKWVNIGSVTEIKASVFDGGRADSKYGGTRTIDCGGADAFVTNSVEGD